MGKDKQLIFHTFYCLSCGNKVLDLPRNRGYLKGKNHFKRLWCPTEQLECNCIECYDDEDVYDFKLDFEEGKYKELAAASIEYCAVESEW